MMSESKKRILHVDDDDYIRHALERGFNELYSQYSFDTVSEPIEVYNMFRENNYDILVTDLKIPNGEEGLDIANRIQEEYNVPVIMYSFTLESQIGFVENAPDKPRSHVHKTEGIRKLQEEVQNLL